MMMMMMMIIMSRAGRERRVGRERGERRGGRAGVQYVCLPL